MKYTKDFDLYLKATKGTEEYLSDKSKAGAIGGSVGRNSPEHNRRLALCMQLANIKKPSKRIALCIKECGPYECGKKYNITIEEGPSISSPFRYKFDSNYHFVEHFKLIKVLK